MNILVYGAGAVGSYVGGHLADAGHNVMLVMRPHSAETINRNGLTLVEGRRPLAVTPTAAPDLRTALATGASFDLIVLGMKTYDLATSLRSLRDKLTSGVPPVLTLQNGIGVEKRVREMLAPTELIAGSLTTPVRRTDDGRILVEKSGRGLAIAPTQPGQSIGPWLALFAATQLQTIACASHQSMKWSKALLNILGNATSAILDWRPQRIYADDRLFDLEHEMVRETLAVMKKLNIAVVNLPGSPARQLALGVRYAPRAWLKPILERKVGGGRGDKMPSFHVDLAAGKPQGEVLYHNGAIAQAGWDNGVPTPVNTTLTAVLLTLIKTPALRDTYRDRPERLLDAVTQQRAQMGH